MITHGNIHRTVLSRLLFAWVVLSVALGAIVLYAELKKADALLHRMALTEAESFVQHIGDGDTGHVDTLHRNAYEFLLKSAFQPEDLRHGSDEARRSCKARQG